MHELVEAPHCNYWQDVHGEQGHVRNIAIVVFHQHGGNQTASVLHAIVEEVSNLFKERWEDWHLYFSPTVVEFLNCEVNECLLVVNVAMVLVSVASVQHHDLGCLVKADVEHVA